MNGNNLSAAGMPAQVAAVLNRTLASPVESVNTDWFGTILVDGLLRWSARGVPEAGDFARRWFAFHRERDPKLSDREFLATYSGNRARVLRMEPLPFGAYCGFFGLGFACGALYEQTGDEAARQVCLSVADAILHRTARNHLGMTSHDDDCDFAIPDTVYFVAPPLMIASQLAGSPGLASVYRDHAIYQLQTNIDVFLDPQTNLAKTILWGREIGRTYWTRASGWLLWAIVGTLRYLEPQHPAAPGFRDALARLTGGMIRAQRADSGSLCLYLDDADSPEETTGTAMFAMGVHEAMRLGWLPVAPYREAVERAWAFVLENIGEEGRIRRAYTGWAVPAEKGEIDMDTREMGWIPGFILQAGDEMTRPLE